MIVPDYQDKKDLTESDQELCDFAFKVAAAVGNDHVVTKMIDHGFEPSQNALKWAFYNCFAPGKQNVRKALIEIGEKDERWQRKINIAEADAINILALQKEWPHPPSMKLVNELAHCDDPDVVIAVGRQAMSHGLTKDKEFLSDTMPWLIRVLDRKQHDVWYYDAIGVNQPDLAAMMYQTIVDGNGYLEKHPFPDFMIPRQVKDQVLGQGMWFALNQTDKSCLAALVNVARPEHVGAALGMAIQVGQAPAIATIFDTLGERMQTMSREDTRPFRKVCREALDTVIAQGDFACFSEFMNKNPIIRAPHLKAAGKRNEGTSVFRNLLNRAEQQASTPIVPYKIIDDRCIQRTPADIEAIRDRRDQDMATVAPFLAQEGHFEAAEQAYNRLPKLASTSVYGAMLGHAAGANQAILCLQLLENHPDISQRDRMAALKEACYKGHQDAFDAIEPGIVNKRQLIDLALVVAEDDSRGAQKSVGWLIEKGNCPDIESLRELGKYANLSVEAPPYLGTVLGRIADLHPPTLDALYADMLAQEKINHRADFVAQYVGAGASSLVGQLFRQMTDGDSLGAERTLNRLSGNPDVLAAAAYFCTSDENRSHILPAVLKRDLPSPTLNKLLHVAATLENPNAVKMLRQYGAKPEAIDYYRIKPDTDRALATIAALSEQPIANQNNPVLQPRFGQG